jgi:hypothetical protein
MVTGELNMNRPSFMMSKGFLTNEELKHGNPRGIKSIDRSLSKLHEHTNSNWSYLDIKPTQFLSPSNFDRVYVRDPVDGLSKNVSLTKVLKDILSTNQKDKMLTIEPKELRNRQINDIKEFIKEGKALFKTPNG